MAQTRTIEIWVGVFIAAGLAALFVLAMQVSNLSVMGEGGSYQLQARFENVSGLKARAPVTMGGVTIGRVGAIQFDDTTYEAVVTLNIDERFNQIPIDTAAGVYTSGLLGEKYVGLEPGGADEMLGNNDVIRLTQSSLVLEQLIGQFLFSKATEGAP